MSSRLVTFPPFSIYQAPDQASHLHEDELDDDGNDDNNDNYHDNDNNDEDWRLLQLNSF